MALAGRIVFPFKSSSAQVQEEIPTPGENHASAGSIFGRFAKSRIVEIIHDQKTARAGIP